MVDRRSFLALSGRMVGTACSPLLIGSCSQGKSGHSREADDTTMLREELGLPAMEILTLAGRAPSGHNTQPWTVRIIEKDHWIIGIAESRRLGVVDATGRETLLSLGTFLENLVTAAAHLGYEAQYDVIAQSAAESEIIDLRLGKAAPVPQRLDRIRLRRTVRNGYLATEITSADLAAITDGGPGFHYFPRGSAGARYLSEGTVEANRKQAFSESAEGELADWIRWSAADAAKYRNGLTPAGMEIDGLSGWYVGHFYNRASVLSGSFRETTVTQVVERVGQGGGWLVVTDDGTTISSLIEAGRVVERMWLRLRERKIAIHPMTQMLEESPWRDEVARNLGIAGIPQFILRIGYLASYPQPASLRMLPGGFLTR